MHGDNSNAEGNGSGDEHDLRPETESEDNSPEIDDSGVDWRAVIGPHPTVQLFSDDDDTDYDAFFANLPPFVPPEPENGEEEEEEEEESSSSSEEDSSASVMEDLQPLDLLNEGRGITGDNKDPRLDLSPEMKAMKETLWSYVHEGWFTLMDHMSPCIIPNISSRASGSCKATNAVSTIYDPLSDHYNKLGCYIFALQKDSENYKKIITYVNKSYGAIIVGKTTYEVEVESVFEIEMVSDHSHDGIKGLPDEVLLLCGTERSNLLRHLHEGFFPAICSLPVPAIMFGRTFQCSNAVAEAARHGYTILDEPEGFLVLGITALREPIIESSSPPEETKSLQAKVRFLVELKFKERDIGVERVENKDQGLELLLDLKWMKETLWSDFCERWSLLMDHMRPCLIPDHQELADHNGNAVRTVDDSLSEDYNKLGCYIFALHKESEEYKNVLKYVEESYEAAIVRQRSYEVEVENVFEIEMIPGPSYDNIRSFPNRVLLLCGTESSRLLRHLHKGFFPAICSLPVPAFMYGRTFLNSNAVAEAERYGYTTVDEPDGFLVLAVTSLREQITELSSPPEDTDSLQASIRFLVELKFKEKDSGVKEDNNKEKGLEVLPEMKSMKKTLWSDFLERWSTFRVHRMPCIIPDHQELPDHAANAVRTIYDPLSDHYNKLGCYIFALPKDSENYKTILAHVEDSYEAATVGERVSYEVEVENVFEIELIAGPSSDDIKSFPYKVMLLCGTESPNLMRHLHEGFFPSICSLPVPEFMFGRAFFCSNAVAEVARYGYTDLEEPEGFLVFAITSLREQISELSSPPQDTKSLQASIKFLVELKFKEKDLGDNRDNINKG